MNDKEKLLFLLQIIRVNGNVMHLLYLDISMVRITQMLENLKKSGHITSNQEHLSLTKKGERLFCQLNYELGKKGMYRYLSPYFHYRITPISIDAVYVPQNKARSCKEQYL